MVPRQNCWKPRPLEADHHRSRRRLRILQRQPARIGLCRFDALARRGVGLCFDRGASAERRYGRVERLDAVEADNAADVAAIGPVQVDARIGLVLHYAGAVDDDFGNAREFNPTLVFGPADHRPAVLERDGFHRADPLMRGAEVPRCDHQLADGGEGGEHVAGAGI